MRKVIVLLLIAVALTNNVTADEAQQEAILSNVITTDAGELVHLERVRLWYPEAFQALLQGCGFGGIEVHLAAGRMHVWAERDR